MSQVISANRLVDGAVVYGSHDGAWVERLSQAKVFANKAESEAGLLLARNDVKRNLVVDPCAVEVAEDKNGLRPLTLREAIRARGPTIDFLPPARVFAYEADWLPGNGAEHGTKTAVRKPRSEDARERELIGAEGSPGDPV